MYYTHSRMIQLSSPSKDYQVQEIRRGNKVPTEVVYDMPHVL